MQKRETHELYKACTAAGTEVWRCPECGFEVWIKPSRVFFIPPSVVVMKEGKPGVEHISVHDVRMDL